ncbi:MAG: sugar phosphate nucleotidyltransferase [Pseudomonadota bacterium]
MLSSGQTIHPVVSSSPVVIPSFLTSHLFPDDKSSAFISGFIPKSVHAIDGYDTMSRTPWFLPTDVTIVPHINVAQSGVFFSAGDTDAPGASIPAPPSLPPGSGSPPYPKDKEKFLKLTSTPEGELSVLAEAVKGTPDGRDWMEMVRLGREGHFAFKELAARPLIAALNAMTKTVLAPRPDNFTSQYRTPWGGVRIVKDIKAGLTLSHKPIIVGESWEISGHHSFPNMFSVEYAGQKAEVSLTALETMFADNMYGQYGLDSHGMHMPFLVKLLNSGGWRTFFKKKGSDEEIRRPSIPTILEFLNEHRNAEKWRKHLGVDKTLKEILGKNYHEIHQGLNKLKNLAARDVLRQSESHNTAEKWRNVIGVSKLEDILDRDLKTIRELLTRLISMQRAAEYTKGAKALEYILRLDELHCRMLEKNLSVQVHPTSTYGGLKADEHSKTEAWIIEHAERGAGIYLGLKEEVTREQFEAALRRGEDITRFLNFVEVKAGDVFFIPAGTMHAIGAGVLLVEPQETSETTYRIYDYKRVDKHGRPRQLHINSAMAVTNWDGLRGKEAVKSFRRVPRQIIPSKGKDPAKVESLIKESVFETRRITFQENQQCEGSSERGIQGFTVLGGSVAVYADDKPLGEFSKGQSFIIPAGMGHFVIKGTSRTSKVLGTSTSLPHGLGVSKPTTSVSATIASQPFEVQAQNAAFVKSERPHVLLINTQGYAGPKVPMGSTDSGGQLTYIAKKADSLVNLGYKVTIVTRAFTHEIVEEEDERGGEKKIKRFQYDTEEYGARRGVAFAHDRIRYVYVPGVMPEDAPFLPKEELYSDLPTIARNLSLFVEDEASTQGKDPWDYFRFIDSHYVDAGIVGGRLVRTWQHELANKHLNARFDAVLGNDFKIDAFEDHNFMGNMPYYFGKRVVDAWKAENQHDEENVFDDPLINEEAVLKWAGQRLGWPEAKVKRLVANLDTPLEGSAWNIGYRLLEVGGDTQALQRQLNAINRHVWTPHSLGRLKEQRVIDAGDLEADPEYYLSLKLDQREIYERALLGGALSGFDKSAIMYPNLTPAAVVGVTSNEIRQTASELGMTITTYSVDFQPGTDPEKYYPRDSVDVSDMKALFADMAERKVVPEDLLHELVSNPQKYNVIVEAGRMDATKRKHILIEAMQHLPENTILFITGKKDGKGVYNKLAKKIDELGLGDRVFLLGMVPDEHMGPLMSLPHGEDDRQFRLAIVASASRMEGWGMAVQDGTSGGLPLVASSYTPYATHLARTDKAARIIKVGQNNEPKLYAEELQGLIDNPPAAREMAKKALSIGRQYQWDPLTKRFVDQVNALFYSGAAVYPGTDRAPASRRFDQTVSPPLHVIVLAGGSGTRFRPYSSDDMPKQFLPVTEKNRSMIQVTAGRFLDATNGEGIDVPPENMWVSTNERYAGLVAEQLPNIPRSNIIGEPVQKNTAPAIATFMHRIAARNSNAIAVIVPSDHYIGSAEIFLQQVQEAAEFAALSGGLITFGIPPTWPSSEYGYIERGEMAEAKRSVSDGVYNVRRFVEKPTLEVARSYIDRGNFLWNSGMFVWTASDFLRHLEIYQPVMHAGLDAVYGSVPHNQPLTAEVMKRYFGSLNGISIDYALMEPASQEGNVYVLPFLSEWSDIGTWQSLKRLVESGRITPPDKAMQVMAEQLAANQN